MPTADSSVSGGLNLGAGREIFAGQTGTTLTFRTLAVQGGLTLEETTTDLVLSTSGLGTVSAIDIQGAKGIVASGGPVTSIGTIHVALTDTGVVPAVYANPTLTIDAQGRIIRAVAGSTADTITAENLGNGDAYLYAQKTNGRLQFRGLKQGGGIQLTETGPLVTIDLVKTGVAGTYANAVLTVDDYGRITAATAGSGGSGTLVSVTIDGSAAISATRTTGTGSVAFALDLKDTAVTPAQYGSATSVPVLDVDQKGRVTGASSIDIPWASTTVPGLVQLNNTTTSLSGTQAATPYAVKTAYDLAASKLGRTETAAAALALATPRRIQLAGDLAGSATFDGSADISISASLPATGVVAGYYTFASVRVDAKGRITEIANGLPPGSSGSGTVTSVEVGGSAAISVSGSPITTTGTINVDLTDTGVAPGAYQNASFVVDAKGRITSAVSGQPGNGSGGSGVTVYSFRINYAADGTITIGNQPAGWSFGVQGSQITITHALGLGIVPISVTSYGYSSAAFPNAFSQRNPNGASSSSYAFVSTNNQFILYSATATNTNSANGRYAIVKIMV